MKCRIPLTIALLACACTVPETELVGKACDAAHLCPAGLSCVGGACRREQIAASGRFSDQAPWNQAIGSDPQVAASSATWVAQIQSLKSPTAGLQLNRDLYTPLVAFANGGAPVVTVDSPYGWRLDNVPMPEDAVTSGDGLGWIIIVDREQGLVWNLAGTIRDGLSVTADGFGLFRSDGPGWWDGRESTYVGYSSGASFLGGLIFPEDLAAGVIPHAIAIEIDVSVIAPMPTPPALTGPGIGTAGNVPVGALLQLDPTFDISGLGQHAQVIARAWQTYGAYVVERGSGIALLFRSSHNLPSDPYAGMDFSGMNGELLRHIRVLAPRASYTYDKPETHSPPMPYRP